MRTQRTLATITAIATLLLLADCTKVKSRNRQINPAVQNDIKASPNQIRLRLRSLVDPFAGEVEQAADTIVANSSDPSVKRAAIRWKIEAVPAIRAALFQPDPFTAGMDTWVFTYQMEDYFETGPGKVALGDAAPLAAETSRRLEREFQIVVATFTNSGDVSKVRDFARQWATDHPIRYAIQDRESTLSRVLETDVGVNWSLGEVVAELTTTADDLHREIQIYSDHLFRQARWEAELLLVDFHGAEVLPLADRVVNSSERAVVTLNDLEPAIKNAADVASNAPALVASERKAVLDAVHEDLAQTLTQLQRERIAAMQQVDGERIAAFREFREERVAVLQQLDEERIAALKEIRDIADSERMALSRDIEQSGLKLVDHATRRAAQLVAAILGFLFLSSVLFLFLIRRLFFSTREPQRWIRRDMPDATSAR